MKAVVLLWAVLTSPVDQTVTQGTVGNVSFNSVVSCEAYKKRMGYSNTKLLQFKCLPEKGVAHG